MINKIIDETKVKIDINEDGTVFIYGTEESDSAKALQMIEDIAKVYEVGEVLEGTVTSITNFGAFVEIGKGTEGLVHISKISKERVNKVEDVVSVGDPIKVKVIEIDDQGRVNMMRIVE